MSKYDIRAELITDGIVDVGTPFSCSVLHAHQHKGVDCFSGTVTEVTPVMTANDVLDDIYAIAKGVSKGAVFSEALISRIDKYRASQETKPPRAEVRNTDHLHETVRGS